MFHSYYHALIRELKFYFVYNKNFDIKTIYLGGGNPSLFPIDLLNNIFDFIYQHFSVAENSEISIELNPLEIDDKGLKEIFILPINRVSMGIQSFSEKNQKLINRVLSAEKFFSIYNKVCQKVKNVNLDFIFDFPNEDKEDLLKNMNMISLILPSHISYYGLSIEEGTDFFKVYNNKEDIFDENKYEEKYFYIHQELEKLGYIHYEISNFSLPEYACKHNLAYWNWEDYIGIGASASSYFSMKRYTNVSQIKSYINRMNNGNLFSIAEFRKDSDILLEKIFLALRQKKGINWKDSFFSEKKKLILEYFHEIPNDLFLLDDNGIRLSVKGFLISNSIAVDLSNYLFTKRKII